MLPANLLTAIKLAIEPKPQPPTAVADDSSSKSGQQFELNQKFQGVVQAQVAPGVFRVRVAEQLVQMQLPSTVRSGDTVAVQVVSVRPRLAFSLVSSTNPLSMPEEQLGSTAKLLSALSQQPPEKAFVRAAQNTPLWDKPQPPESGQLAGLLREALGNSGLFYESHQAQWMEGARSLAQLQVEPQNLPPDQARVVVANNAAGHEEASEQASDAPASLQSPARQPAANMSDIPDHLQPLVQQQLNALETREMVWQGYVWPEQTMQWEIRDEERASRQTPRPDGTQRQWVTELRLDLPRLGPVAATLRLGGAGVNLTLQAERTETRAEMDRASARLVSALQDAGIAVLGARIEAP